MYSPSDQEFLNYLKGQTPRCQLFHYYNLFEDKNKYDLALRTSPYFYSLALDNELIGCFNKITNLLSIYCKGSIKEPSELNAKRKQVESNYYRQMNNLKKQIQNVKNKEGDKGLAALYFQISQVGLKYGQYQEAEQHLRKIRDLKVMPQQDFYPLLLKANILSKKIQRSGAVILPNLSGKKMQTPQILQFFVGEGMRQVFEGKANFFTGLLNVNPHPSRLAHNQFATLQTIGDIYSILIVANGNRRNVRTDVNFSSGFQHLYLNYKYNQFLVKANEVLDKYRFNPFIQNRIGQIKNKLKNVLLFEVLNAYKVVKIDTVISMLGYTQKDIETIISQNRKAPSGRSQYQIDPLERTIVLMEEGNPIIQYLQQVNRGLEQRQIRILTDQIMKAQRAQQGHGDRDFDMDFRKGGNHRHNQFSGGSFGRMVKGFGGFGGY